MLEIEYHIEKHEPLPHFAERFADHATLVARADANARELRRRSNSGAGCLLRDAVLPKSKPGKAADYAMNMWFRFETTLETVDARLNTNDAENGAWPAAVGRKNWLQLGSAGSGGGRIEVFLSPAQSCVRLGANPFEYFADVIERVSIHPQVRIEELTPRGWMRPRGLSHAGRADGLTGAVSVAYGARDGASVDGARRGR